MAELNSRLIGFHHLGHNVWTEVQRVLKALDPDQTLIQGRVADDLHAAVEAALVSQVETTVTNFISAL